MNENNDNKPRRLLVLDVDGVIFNGQFLLHLAQPVAELADNLAAFGCW